MRLPDDLFASLVGCALQMEKKRGAERRMQGRVRLLARIHVVPVSKQAGTRSISAQVRDLSHQGVGLLLPQRLAVGDLMLARLMSKDTAVWVLCSVARVEKVAEGLFVTGATFDRIVERGGATAEGDFHALLPRG